MFFVGIALKTIEAKSLEEDLAAANPNGISEEAWVNLIYVYICTHITIYI